MKKSIINRTNLMIGISLMLLQVCDAYITLVVVNLVGIDAEINPVVKFFIKNYGALEGLIIVKLIVFYLVAGLIIYNKKILYIRNLLIVALIFYIVLLGYMTINTYDIIF